MPTADADLLDLALEDDALLPPSLLEDFVGFRLSSSERSCYEWKGLPTATRNDRLLGTLGHDRRSLHQNVDYGTNRKSLSWHGAFLSNEGILDSEELMMYNQGLKEAAMLPSQVKNATKLAQKPQKRLYGSSSMPRVTAKRTATDQSRTAHKKSHSWLSSIVISSPVSSFSGGSAKTMFKSSMNFLKKNVGSSSAASSAGSTSRRTLSKSSSIKSKLDNMKAGHPGSRSMPTIPSQSSASTTTKYGHSTLLPSTPPQKEALAAGSELSAPSMSLAFTPPTKETMFRTPGSKPSSLRLPSARFGFFDLDQRPSSRWEQIFHSKHASKSQEPFNACTETTEFAPPIQSPITTSTTSRSVKPRVSVPSVQCAAKHPLDANGKENKCKIEARIDGLSKLLRSIELESDLVIDLQGKKGAIQLYLTDYSATRPSKARRYLASISPRTPLAACNKSRYTSASCRY